MVIVKWEPIWNTERVPPLGEELRRHIEAYKNGVRHASCSAWGLLYRLLEENGLEAGEVAFEENGKPFFRGNPIYFSLSHSRDICAAAVSDKPIGVDVEIVKDSYNSHLVARSLSPEEKMVFDGDFARIWCRKESIAKLTGRGLTGYPADIDTLSHDFKEESVSHNGALYWLIACSV
jgi:phosphopantetheinyl transferase